MPTELERALADTAAHLDDVAPTISVDEILRAAGDRLPVGDAVDQRVSSRRWLTAAAVGIVLVGALATALAVGRGDGEISTVPPPTSSESDVVTDAPSPDWEGISGLDATVIGSSPDSLDQRIEIDRGSVHGVVVGMPVIDAAGLVGRITNVYPETSVVSLLANPEVVVSAKSVSTGPTPAVTASGAVRGDGADAPLRFDSPSETSVNVGDSVLTLGGDDSLEPPGIPIGQVVNVIQPGAADVEAAADLADLHRVQVLLYRPPNAAASEAAEQAGSSPLAREVLEDGAPVVTAVTASDEQRAAWSSEGDRLIRAKQDAFDDGPYEADGQALGFAAQSDAIDIIEPGRYELRFQLDDSARLPDGTVVAGFAVNAPPWFTLEYWLEGFELGADDTMSVDLFVPEQAGFVPFEDITFWIY